MAKKPRGVFIAGNWKMNFGLLETKTFFSSLSKLWITPKNSTPEVALFVPATSIAEANRARGALPVRVGAQNAHWEMKGAFTGELSAPMLAELGVSDVLVAHSERRQFFGETDESARKRTEGLLAQGFRVMLCVGETRAEREANQTEAVLQKQIKGAITPGGAAQFLDGRLTIAYEPVWAIGTGLTATPAEAESAHQFIRRLLWDSFGMEASARTPILYGGSVTPGNIETLLTCPNIDGALVGGASLKPESFWELVQKGMRVA